MTNSVIEKSCHRVMMGKTYWKGVVLPSALYGAEVIDMKAEEIDKLQKAENTAMRRILKAPSGLHKHPRWEEWRIESRSLQRPRIEETDQVLGEFLFGGHENNTKKRTLLKMWNERQRLIRNNQENAET